MRVRIGLVACVGIVLAFPPIGADAKTKTSSSRTQRVRKAERVRSQRAVRPPSRPAKRNASNGRRLAKVTARQAKQARVSRGDRSQWATYDKVFVSKTKAAIRRGIHHYRRAKKNNHPYIKYLEKHGFRFTGKITVPPIRKVLAGYQRDVKQLIASGAVRENEVLRPARILGDGKGNLIYRQYGQPIPKGFSGSAGIAPLPFVLNMMAKGFFPIGEHSGLSSKGLRTNMTVFMHDFSHFDGFVQHPRMMAELRKTAASLYKKGVDFPHPAAVQLRVVLENLEVVRPSARPVLKRGLGLPKRPADHRYNVAEVKQSLGSLTRAQLRSKTKEAYALYQQHVIPIGGSARDIVQMAVRMKQPDNGYSHYFTITHNAAKALRAANGGRATKAQLVTALAKLQVSMYEATRLDPIKVVKELRQPPSKNHQGYRFYVGTGAFDKASSYHKGFENQSTSRDQHAY